jgi:ceramide glucosyltransferase
MVILAAAGAIWWVVAVLLLLLTLAGALLQPWLQRRRSTRADRPPVSMILPVKLLDPGFERAQTSAFAQAYPDYEVVVGAAEAASPALDAMAAIARCQQDRPACIRQSSVTSAASPKLNVIAAALEGTAHDLVFTKDSNISLPPDALASFVAALTPDVGLVVGVPVAVRPERLGGHLEALLVNGHARLLLTASALGLGFGIGKAMLFRKSDLARLGGIPSLSHTIAEDSALAKGMGGIGLKTRFAARAVDQETGARSLRAVYERQVRWAVIRRGQQPAAYLFEPLVSPFVAACAAALAAPLAGLESWVGFLLTLVLWGVCEGGLNALKGWGLSGWTVPAFLGREVVSLAAWTRAWVRQDVVWATGRYDLSAEMSRAPSGRRDEG